MSTIIKSYTSIILIIIAALTLGGIISATIDVRNARDYHAAIVDEIEESNHAQDVIDMCKEEAKKNGYELIVESYQSDSDEGNDSMISKVTLKYNYKINFLKIKSNHEIIGYAR